MSYVSCPLNPAKIFWQLLFPDGPVVNTPGRHIELVPDSFAVQQTRHLVVGIFANIVFCSAQHNIHAVELVVVGVGQKVGRVIVVHIFVVVPVQKRLDVVGSAQQYQVPDLFGVLKRKVEGVVPTEGNPAHTNFLHIALPLNTRNEFFVQEAVVQYVVPDAGAGVQVLAVPAVQVDTGDAV